MKINQEKSFCLYDYGYLEGDWNASTKRTLQEFLEIVRRRTDNAPDDKIYLSLDINPYNLHNDVSAELTISVEEDEFK